MLDRAMKADVVSTVAVGSSRVPRIRRRCACDSIGDHRLVCVSPGPLRCQLWRYQQYGSEGHVSTHLLRALQSDEQATASVGRAHAASSTAKAAAAASSQRRRTKSKQPSDGDGSSRAASTAYWDGDRGVPELLLSPASPAALSSPSAAPSKHASSALGDSGRYDRSSGSVGSGLPSGNDESKFDPSNPVLDWTVDVGDES